MYRLEWLSISSTAIVFVVGVITIQMYFAVQLFYLIFLLLDEFLQTIPKLYS